MIYCFVEMSDLQKIAEEGIGDAVSLALRAETGQASKTASEVGDHDQRVPARRFGTWKKLGPATGSRENPTKDRRPHAGPSPRPRVPTA